MWNSHITVCVATCRTNSVTSPCQMLCIIITSTLLTLAFHLGRIFIIQTITVFIMCPFVFSQTPALGFRERKQITSCVAITNLLNGTWCRFVLVKFNTQAEVALRKLVRDREKMVSNGEHGCVVLSKAERLFSFVLFVYIPFSKT